MNVFIAGPRAIFKLDKLVEDKLNNIYKKEITVLDGDANGIDKSIQKYFLSMNYKNVIVYASQGKARNNVGNWEIKGIDVQNGIKGFEFYKQKDLAMSNDADYGFMIWNGISKGILNNIINLININKKVLVYFTPQKKFVLLENEEQLKKLLILCPQETIELCNKLSIVKNKCYQLDMFETASVFREDTDRY